MKLQFTQITIKKNPNSNFNEVKFDQKAETNYTY